MILCFFGEKTVLQWDREIVVGPSEKTERATCLLSSEDDLLLQKKVPVIFSRQVVTVIVAQT